MKTTELIDIIKNNKIVIYGAGYVAKNFYKALKVRGLCDRVVCFIVSEIGNGVEELYGIPVKEAKDLINQKDLYICIAVHETIRNEIEEYLSKYDVDKYIWIHPYIMELALGEVIAYHKPVKIKEIMQDQKYDEYKYAVAIRYLAIENFYNKNNIGYQIYLKALNLQCEKETAKKRLNSFIRLITNWDERGYQEEYDILIDERKRLIDGTHRLSLACYHKMEWIYCNIFPYSPNYGQFLKKNHFLSIETLLENHFTVCELEALKEVQKRMMMYTL